MSKTSEDPPKFSKKRNGSVNRNYEFCDIIVWQYADNYIMQNKRVKNSAKIIISDSILNEPCENRASTENHCTPLHSQNTPFGGSYE